MLQTGLSPFAEKTTTLNRYESYGLFTAFNNLISPG